jgi:hypothetical protein
MLGDTMTVSPEGKVSGGKRINTKLQQETKQGAPFRSFP